MRVNKNEFFRQATLRICSSLDIEKALLKCLQYIEDFMPVTEMYLNLFEPGMGIVWNLATVNRDGGQPPFPPTPMSKEAIDSIESGYRLERMVKIIDRTDLDPVTRLLLPHTEFSKQSYLVMILEIEGEQLGSLGIAAEGEEQFTETHARLISFLCEPLAIAVSNALRYQEVLKLKEMVDAENRDLNRELRYFSGDEIVGAEYGLNGVMEMVRQVAPLNSPVMLLGETGAGKEVIANAIHYSSSRKNAPFVKVNCGAIPDNLLDSELFGHERGAFTGAISQKRGRFERAEKGSIFLDEIAEIPTEIQVKLLRVIQEREIERVGGEKSIPLDVRIIAATQVDLDEAVKVGTFRTDLYWRLNVIRIHIPSLRDRQEDVLYLSRLFVEEQALKFGVPVNGLSADAEARLMSMTFPGNVRELKNILERAVVLCDGPRVTEHDLLPLDDDLMDDAAKHNTLKESIASAERQAIFHALVESGWVIGEAAQLLGISRKNLWEKMKRYGIEKEN